MIKILTSFKLANSNSNINKFFISKSKIFGYSFVAPYIGTIVLIIECYFI